MSVDEVSRLLFDEAQLLDSGQFDAWLELLAPDLRYWAPVRLDVSRADEAADEASRLPLFDETRESLELRVKRLATGFAWIESPPSRTRRFVTNVMVDDDKSGRLRVRSNLLVFRSRSPGDETLFSGRREDRWSRQGRWLLHERKIIVDHRTVENMSQLL